MRQARPSVGHPRRSAKAQGGDVRKQEQGGCTVPVRRVAICCSGGGEIDGGIAVQALERLKSSNTHEDSVRLHSSSNDFIQFEVREAHANKGGDPLPRLR